MKRPLIVGGALFLCIGLFAGCASTGALDKARASFQKAKAAGAETRAPYEYYLAEAYLVKAEQELSEGDKSQAAVFAAESEKHAVLAAGAAEGGAK